MNVFEDNKSLVIEDLNTLARLLVESGICNDNKPIYDAVGQCLHYSNDEAWQYRIENLIFDGDTMGHTIPRGADLIRILFSIDVKGRYYKTNSICNPLITIELNIELFGALEDIDDLYAAWHFDRHIYDEEGERTKFIHPEFHFTYGGRRMWDRSFEYGSSLIMPAPRFTHPPMDGVLGIDFVIQNYIRAERHRALTESQLYRQAVANSQYRMWRPYHCAIADHWRQYDNTCDDTISPITMLPNLIVL